MSLFSPFTTTAANQAASAIQGSPGSPWGVIGGETAALPYYSQGQNQISQYGQAALSPLNQNFGTATQGLGAYGNALGLNGPQGTQQAIQAFQSSPQYSSSLGAANAGSAAANAASGRTDSGSGQLAAMAAAQNTANQGWQNYVAGLQPYMGLAQNTGGQIAGTNMGIGSGLNASSSNIGNMFYGGALTGAQASAAAYLAQNQAGANQFNALTGLGAGILGGSSSGNPLMGLGSGLGSLFGLSDAKLKEDIEPVGALYDGTNVYRYRFKGSPRTEIGLIAQEVEQTTPEAVVEFLPDLRAVDYRRATERAAKILEFSRQQSEPMPTHRPFASELMEIAA